MAIPAGISTALVHLDAPVSFIGDDGRIHATITSSIPLVWAATGTPIGNFIENVSLDPGIPLELQLPHVDQPGFLDGAGNTVMFWSYRIEVTYEKDGQNIPFPARDFQILDGQVEVDLALIPSGEAHAPEVAPILPVTSIEGLNGEVTLIELALDRVDNTNDLEKPISTAAQAALNLKATTAALTAHTGNTANPHAVTKAQVGLGNADNTSDALKPISTATQTALNGKAASVHGHTYADITGMVPTSALPPLAINETTPVATQAAMLALVAQRGDMAIRTDNGKTYVLATDSPGTLADWKEVMATGQVVSVAGKTGLVLLVKADVGLSEVDNTSDLLKPVSTATQAALDGKSDTGHTHTIANVTGLQGALDGKSPTGHTHAVGDTTGLQAALDAKAAKVGAEDIEITDATKGLILESPDGTRYRVTVADGGALSAVAVV